MNQYLPINNSQSFSEFLLSKLNNSSKPAHTFINNGKLVSKSNERIISESYSFAKVINEIKTSKANYKVGTLLFNNSNWVSIELGVHISNSIFIPLSFQDDYELLLEKIKLLNLDLILVDSKIMQNKLKALKIEVIYLNNVSLSKPTEPIKQKFNNDLALILFTSASEKKAKAVAFSHQNLINAYFEFAQSGIFKNTGKYLEIMHHSFSGTRKINYAAQLLGLEVCYQNRVLSIEENIKMFKPDIMGCVPRFLPKIIKYCYENKDNLSLKKIICGGAPLNSQVYEEFERFNIKLYNVYGLTETTSIGAYNTPKHFKRNSCGKISKTMSFKVNSKNELLLKGKSLSLGYYFNNKINTHFDNEGYFNTKDIVSFDEENFLFINKRNVQVARSTKSLPECFEKIITKINGKSK